jgi:hypothetical protein
MSDTNKSEVGAITRTDLIVPNAETVNGRVCVIQDPAGAVAALFEPAT